MDKRTLLAIVISIGIFIVYMIVQSTFFKPEPLPINQTRETEEKVTPVTDSESEIVPVANIVPREENEATDQIISKTEQAFTVKFSTKGGLIQSLILNEYRDIDKTPIDMVKSGDSGIYPFIISFGDYSTANDIFTFKANEEDHEYHFSRQYTLLNDDKEIPFTLTKTYKFDDSYFIKFEITLESNNREYLALNYNNIMYTLTYGPQIGPGVEIFDARKEFPQYIYLNNENKKNNVNNKVKNKKYYTIEKDTTWVAIEGKYFAIIIDPPSNFNENHVGFDIRDVDGLSSAASIFLKRPYEKRVTINEEFTVYVGPKIKDKLKHKSTEIYQKLISGVPVIDQIVGLLRLLLTTINGLVKNWGVSIIIMTIIIKVVFFPLSQKGFQSTAKIQALNPKIEEIKAKYKDNPQKTQAEIGNLYKEHKINPLAGCLPWLIQIPIFISLFSLLRNQFDLRGAVFIPGWINDLSSPENLWKFPVAIPLVNWTHLNILPIVMTVMMVVQQKFTQKPNSAGTNQMKMLMYMMPAVFFFICYNMPSGVVLYWTIQNFISLFQQFLINKVQKKDPGAESALAVSGKPGKKKK